jgi:hypothetical protein
MNSQKDIQESYKQWQLEMREKELTKNSALIRSFIDYCASKHIVLTEEHFDYIQTIGIVAKYPNIVHLLNRKIVLDKEELVEVSTTEKEYRKEWFVFGYYYSDKYMVMAHPYFRRGYRDDANFPPRFIELFWGYNKDNIQKYIAIDNDRVRINVDDNMYEERAIWHGANFQKSITDIKDGIVKLRPPLNIELNFIFGNTYSLDIKWNTKDGIKSFQAEEFKEDDEKIIKGEITYFPVKYLHAEFDINTRAFRHFDGSIHFYKEEEYYQRRESDFNYNDKNNLKLKTLSQKLFKINGRILTEDWVKLVSHYLIGDPLIFEYFEGKLPEKIATIIETRLRNEDRGL